MLVGSAPWWIPFWRAKPIHVWMGRGKSCTWPKNQLQFFLKSQKKGSLLSGWQWCLPLQWQLPLKPTGIIFLCFCSSFSQAFALLSPDLRWCESTKLMQESHASSGQGRIPAEAPSHDIPNLPGAMASPRKHPHLPRSYQPLGQHSLNCIRPKARTRNTHMAVH